MRASGYAEATSPAVSECGSRRVAVPQPKHLSAAEAPAIVGRLGRLLPVISTRAGDASTRVGSLELAVGLGCALVAVAGTIGADARWLAALGQAIVEHGAIPHGVPFASAPSGDWPNVPVLGELILHWLTAAFGDRGLLLAQLVAVAAGLAFVAADARRGRAEDLGAAFVVLLIVIGALPALLIIRAQLFSLLLFPALAALVRKEARAPSWRVWLVPPLLALWSNLHGAVLVGLAVAAAYLVLARARTQPLAAAAALLASALAVCATPALERTPIYYLGVLRNEAARRGEGLWAPLSLSSGFDLLLLASGIVLVALALRARPALWETVVLVALAILTIRTARSGIWLLLFAGPPAARTLRFGVGRRASAALAIAAALVVFGLARGPLSTGADKQLLDDALHRAAGTPILADGVIAEQVAQAGGRVWMSNPLDAFSLRDQRLYLDWIDGRPNGVRAFTHAPRVVLVSRDSKAAKLAGAARGLREAASDSSAILYVREPGG
jgi:hypothetical protein